MKKFVLFLGFLGVFTSIFSQKYLTKTGHINFFSSTPVEDINADNYKVSSVLDASTGNLVFKLSVESFEFKKKLMQEHFNENYMESDTYPNSTFKGKITNMGEVDLDTPGEYDVNVVGKLTIHGVTKEISTTGQLHVADESLSAKSEFTVSPSDYEIVIPKLVRGKIGKELLIKVELEYEKMK